MSSNKNRIISQAQKFIQKGQWDKAIKELQKLIAEDPSDVRTLLKLGDVLMKKGEREQATKVYKQVAESYSEQGFFLKAVAVYKQILKHEPKQLEVTLKLAELYEHLGLTSEAMAQYQGASQIHDEAGNSKDALDVLKRMVELDAENVASRIKLAESYSRENLTQEAVAEFGRAAEILRRQNRLDDFIKVAERLVYHDPNRLDVVRELAQLYLKRNDTKRALAKLQLCFKAQPKDIETLNLLAVAFRDLGQVQKTIFVYRELAKVHADQGNDGEARQVMQRILELDPADAEAHAMLGNAPPAGAPPAAAAPQGLFATTTGRGQSLAPSASSPAFDVAVPRAPSFAPRPTPPRVVTGSLGASTLPPPQFPPREISLDAGQETAYPAHAYAGYEEPPPPVHPSMTPGRAAYAPARMGGSAAMLDAPAVPVAPLASGGAVLPEPSKSTMGMSPAQVQIGKILTETDVYIKYGLREKALEHLRRVFEIDPDNVLAYAKMRDMYLANQDAARAAESVANIVHIHARRGDMDALESARAELSRLAPGHPLIAGVPSAAGAQWSLPGEGEDSDSIDITEDADVYMLDEVAEEEPGAQPYLEAPSYVQVPEAGASSGDQLDAWLQGDPVEDDAEENTAELLRAQPAQPAEPTWSAAEPDPFAGQVDSDGLGDEALEQGLHAHAQAPEDEPEELPEVTTSSVVALEEIGYSEYADAPAAPFSTGEEEAQADAMAADVLPTELGEGDPESWAGGPPEAQSLGQDLLLPPREAAAPRREEPAPAEPETEHIDLDALEDELDEAEFLADQGLVQEARDSVLAVLERWPHHVRAREMAARFGAQAGEAEAAELAEEQGPGGIEPEDVAEAFEAAGAQGDDESADDHFDQGLAYKELGRLDDAIAHFRQSLGSPTRALDSQEMIGHCLAAKGEHEAAINAFWAALEQLPDGEPAATNLKYEIAATYEAAGDMVQALTWFNACATDDPEHRDVRERLRALESGDNGPNGEHGGQGEPLRDAGFSGFEAMAPTGDVDRGKSAKKSKISYI